MPKRIIGQNTFTTGIISPRLYSRSDVDEFKKGLAEATNALITPQGPISRRNGTEYIAHAKDHSTDLKLVRYQFSQDVAYILEFGDLYIRFYSPAGQIVESDITITGITAANPGVVTATGHGLSNGDHVYITEVVGMTEVNNSSIPYVVANKTANTFELTDIDGANVDTSAYTAYSSAGVINKIYEITSPYEDTDLEELEYVQLGTTLYIVHPETAPYTLVRSADTNWTLSAMDFYPPPTYEPGYAANTTMTPAATTGTSVNFTAGAALFLQGDVGRQIVNLSGAGRAAIVSITSTTVAVCDIVENFPSTSAIASGDWKLDLSPIVDLDINNTSAGSIAIVKSEYPAGTLGSAKTITGITNANPAVVTSTAHGFSNGEKVQIQYVVGMTQLNDHIFTVASVTANTFELLGENSTGYTAYSSGGIARKVFTDIACDAFRSADVGKYILVNGGVVQILSVDSATSITTEIIKTLNDTDTTGNWSLEEPTWDATRGYPRAVGFYQQRLLFGGSTAQPQTIWGSEIGIYDGFGTGPDDEDAIETEIVSDEVNQINWLSSGRDLVIGTSGGEATISSGSSATSISPSSLLVQPRTYMGSKSQQVDNIKEEILFIQGSERKIRTFRYNFNIDGYESDDITYLIDHLTEGGLKELAYAQEPDTLLYVVHDDGNMLVGLYDRGKKLVGWTNFTTDGYYKNVQTITHNEEDEVWVVVKRKIDGSWRQYIEKFTSGDGLADTDTFVDCSLTLSTPLTITGITNANPAVVTSTAHGLSNGDTVIIKGLIDPLSSELDPDSTDLSDINGNIYTVAGVTANTFQLSGLNTTDYNSYGSGGYAYKRVTALTGLSHLEGKTVSLRVDGAVAPAGTVSNGALTLATAGGEVVVGLKYTTTITTLDYNFDLGLGPMQGQRVRWARPQLRVYNSTKPLMNGEYLPNRNTSDLLSQAVGLYTGFLEYGGLDWSNVASLTFVVSDPLPLHISGIVGTIESGVK